MDEQQTREILPFSIIGIYNLFMSLQNEDIVDNSAPMTKTEFAYEYGKNS